MSSRIAAGSVSILMFCVMGLGATCHANADVAKQSAESSYEAAPSSTDFHLSQDAQALFDAVEQGNAARVKALLDKGVPADPDVPNGFTPLMDASMMNHPAIVKLLLSRGANVNTATKGRFDGGMTALILATAGFANMMAGAKMPDAPKGYDGHEAEYIKKHPNQWKKWVLQCVEWFKGYDVIVRLLVDKGADVNSLSATGDSAIANAAGDTSHDSIQTVQFLLDHGARLDLASVDASSHEGPFIATTGYHALLGAVFNKNVAMVRLLLDHGAKPDAEAPMELTPLTKAASDDNLVLVQLLLEHGADVNAYDFFGNTALEIAKGEPKLTAILVKAGAKDLPRGPHPEIVLKELHPDKKVKGSRQ